MQKFKTIVVTNRKGGVGKTTVATHLASGLAMMGLRVAIVDTDSQGHVASAFGLPKSNGLYKIMIDEDTKFVDVMVQIPPVQYTPPGWDLNSHLYFLPGDKGTSYIAAQQSSALRFSRVIGEMAELLELDYVVVDTSPSNSMFDGSIYFAADYMLHVTECAALSFDGLSESMNELRILNKDNKKFRVDDVKVLGLLPNKARFSTNNHRDNIALLAEQFGLEMIWSPVTLSTVWESAMEYGQTVFSYAPYEQQFKDAWTIVAHALEGLGEINDHKKMVDEIMKAGLVNASA